MDRVNPLKKKLWLLFLTIIGTIFCYFFVDRQVVIWISLHHVNSFAILKYLSHIPDLVLVALPVIYLGIVVRFSRNRWTMVDQQLLMFANGIAITQFFKALFKNIFGRYWPETWYNNNPSLISHNQYGFHPFYHGVMYGSFPSGHAATLLAAITMLWFIYPAYRWLYLITTLAGLIGILGMNYHFVSDILAGSALGYIIARFTLDIGVLSHEKFAEKAWYKNVHQKVSQATMKG